MGAEIISQLKRDMSKTFETCIKCCDAVFNFFFFLPCGGEATFRNRCIDFATVKDGDRILDLCCGTGDVITTISKRGMTVHLVGIDVSDSAIETAVTKTRFVPVTLIRARADDLPLKSSQFDKCFISFGLHHMSCNERQKALREVHRTLTPKGNLYIIDYNLPEGGLKRLISIVFIKLDKSKEVFGMLKSGGLDREIKHAGFEITKQRITCQGITKLIKVVKT